MNATIQARVRADLCEALPTTATSSIKTTPADTGPPEHAAFSEPAVGHAIEFELELEPMILDPGVV